MTDKKFDAVQMTRDIRDKMAEEWLADPEAERRELERIRKKYGLERPAAQPLATAGKKADSESSSG